jgi:hypothetical protein
MKSKSYQKKEPWSISPRHDIRNKSLRFAQCRQLVLLESSNDKGYKILGKGERLPILPSSTVVSGPMVSIDEMRMMMDIMA